MELATQRPAHAVAARGRKHGSGYALVVSPPILLAPFAATVTITVDGVLLGCVIHTYTVCMMYVVVSAA